MCSVGDDNFENGADKVMSIKEKIVLSDKKCNKCRTAKSCVVLRHKDTYCKNCFLAAATHKFKALLGKSRLISPNDQVLICHKIGHPSTALMHLLRTGLDLNTPKKFRFVPIVLFIEDQLQLSFAERQDVLKQAEQEVKSFGFKLYFISFVEYVLNPNKITEIIKHDHLNINEKDNDKLKDILDKCTSKTNKNDLLNLFKRQLLVDAAKHLNCKYIFTPEISIDIASHLLTNVSLGRGCHIPIDTGFCDDRDDEVKILRPLRLFDLKELAFYNKFNNLEPIFIRQRDVNPYSSVQDLMKKFVKELQENFPATVTTVMKTGDKLALDKGNSKTCQLCKGIIPKQNAELTSEESTKFSHLISTTTPDYTASRQERYQCIADNFDYETVSVREHCYACSKISCFIK